MIPVRQIGFILATMLLVNSFASALAIAQQDEGVALDKRVGELYQAGKFSEAMPLAQRALAIHEKALGLDHPGVVPSLIWLALLYKQQGRDGDAEPLYRRALAIQEKALGPDHPNVATSLSSLAFLYNQQGRYVDAEPLFKRALAIQEKALGPNHPNVATPLIGLAVIYDHQGRYSDAESLFRRALAIQEKALGPDHPDVATTLISWLINTSRKVATRTPSRSIGERWRSRRKRSVPTIPMSRQRSITWGCFT